MARGAPESWNDIYKLLRSELGKGEASWPVHPGLLSNLNKCGLSPVFSQCVAVATQILRTTKYVCSRESGGRRYGARVLHTVTGVSNEPSSWRDGVKIATVATAGDGIVAGQRAVCLVSKHDEFMEVVSLHDQRGTFCVSMFGNPVRVVPISFTDTLSRLPSDG